MSKKPDIVLNTIRDSKGEYIVDTVGKVSLALKEAYSKGHKKGYYKGLRHGSIATFALMKVLSK